MRSTSWQAERSGQRSDGRCIIRGASVERGAARETGTLRRGASSAQCRRHQASCWCRAPRLLGFAAPHSMLLQRALAAPWWRCRSALRDSRGSWMLSGVPCLAALYIVGLQASTASIPVDAVTPVDSTTTASTSTNSQSHRAPRPLLAGRMALLPTPVPCVRRSSSVRSARSVCCAAASYGEMMIQTALTQLALRALNRLVEEHLFVLYSSLTRRRSPVPAAPSGSRADRRDTTDDLPFLFSLSPPLLCLSVCCC